MALGRFCPDPLLRPHQQLTFSCGLSRADALQGTAITLSRECRLRLSELIVRPVAVAEETRFQALMRTHHYLGALPKIGHTVWYVAAYDEQWVALLSFSAAALKCGARDRWIGWDLRHHYDRLHPIANQSRFAILTARTISATWPRGYCPYAGTGFRPTG